MIRDEDVSGVSGTGPVGEIVEFESGWVAVSFYGFTADVPNVIVWSLLRRPPNPLVKRLRLGVFVERDREKPGEKEPPWPDDDTKELPPR